MGDNSTAFSLPQVCCIRQPFDFSFPAIPLAALMAVNFWVLKYLTSVDIMLCGLKLIKSVKHDPDGGLNCLTFLF
jgi:hypothetical protein